MNSTFDDSRAVKFFMPDFQVIPPLEPSIHVVCASCGHPIVAPDHTPLAEETPATAPAIAENGGRGRFVAGDVLAERYRVIDMLGSGGTGEVYRVHDTTLNQQVALKLFPRIQHDHMAMERLHREVRLARQISHGNVCRVFDIGEAAGHPFITMEFVTGEDLQKLLRRIGHLSSDKAIQVARQLCAGLAAAHEAGVLHRDLKPANVMLDGRGNVRITDFGLAVLAEDLHDFNAGTPGYMAPEQLTGQEVTIRSDIYALGLVLHEIFTGKRVLDPHAAVQWLRSGAKKPIPVEMPGVHPLIPQIVSRCLAANAARRPASAVHVATELARAARLGAGKFPRRIDLPVVPPQRPTILRMVWSLIGAALTGALLMLILAPASTGVGLSFEARNTAAPLTRVFSWLWCIAFQLLVVIAAIVYVVKSRPTTEDAVATQE
jgi:serine/threonine-protein kinase